MKHRGGRDEFASRVRALAAKKERWERAALRCGIQSSIAACELERATAAYSAAMADLEAYNREHPKSMQHVAAIQRGLALGKAGFAARTAAMKAMRDKGVRTKEIAEKFGISQWRVCQLTKKEPQ